MDLSVILKYFDVVIEFFKKIFDQIKALFGKADTTKAA